MFLLSNHPDLWRARLPVLKREGNKYDRGHALILGGGVMTGAARLAARAAQRMGTGLVTLASPSESLAIYAAALESVIVKLVGDVPAWRELLVNPKIDVVLVGPGLGLGLAQKEFVLAALAIKKPCVLDADALTNFTDNPQQLLSALHDNCVMTPHEGEFARVFPDLAAEPDKILRVQQAAQRAGCVVLLKGTETVIAAPDGRVIINTNAPPWLATAGAGDVLAGMILGLMAQGMEPFWAAAASAWIHGEAANAFGHGLIAEDLIDELPRVLTISAR